MHEHPLRTSENGSGRRTGAVIEVDGLVKSYDGVRAVDDLSFRVERGEIFGLLGANGAGKTTAVECLQGLRRPDAGYLRVLDLDPVVDRSRLRRLSGSQLQDSALPDRLRVGEAIALFDRDRARRFDPGTHLDTWGLGDKRNTSFADLSGGQRQRLFIALALLNDPEVVFLDELTQGLDPAARRDVWDVIRSVRERGTTVVLVSHFADEIEALCDRVVVMSRGRIVDAGTPRQVTDRHADATVITFSWRDPCSLRRSADALRRVPHVGRVDLVDQDGHDSQLRVLGTSEMVAPVCAAVLDERGAGPPDLRVQHAELDDALVNLIGADR